MKKVLSVLLAFVLTFSPLVSNVAFAANPSGLDYTAQVTPVAPTVSSEAQEITVKFSTTKPVTVYTIGGEVSIPSGWTIKAMTNDSVGMTGQDVNTSDGKIVWASSGSDIENVTELITVTYTVPANAEGDFNVSLADISLAKDYGFTSVTDRNNHETCTTTITIGQPSAAPAYELYYTLDKTETESPEDYYVEYDLGEEVVATIYLKAKNPDVLQAFDFTVTNDSNLEFVRSVSTWGTRVEYGDEANKSSGTLQHIQAVGASKDHPINEPIPADEKGLEIAKITYKVKNSAVYNKPMDITISEGANFAVQNTAESFVPEIQSYTSKTQGVETLKTWDVSFNTDGGTSYAAQKVGHNLTATNPGTPEKTGYTFEGWYADNAYTTAFDFDTKITKDTTVYAKWQPKQYTITFQNDDGTVLQKSEMNYGAMPVYDQNAHGSPTKNSNAQYTYTWTGWTPTIATVTEDATYTATYSSEVNKYTVTWKNYNDETLSTTANVEYGTTPSYSGATPTRVADAQYTYTYDGWSSSKGGEKLTELPGVTGDVTYWAHYSTTTNKYNVTFDAQGHGAAPAGYTDEKRLEYDAKVPNPGELTETGWTFGGWYKEAACTNRWDFDSDTVTGTTVIYAKWTENTYTIHYEGNGNSSGTAPADQTNIGYTNESVAIADRGSLVRDGYKFQSWNTKEDGSGIDISGTKKMSDLVAYAVDGKVTLYAKWGTEAYTIIYDYNGGTLPEGKENRTGYNVTDLPITLNQPEKTGYVFKNWTITAASDPGKVVAEGDVIKSGTYGDLTVKANWDPATDTAYQVEHLFQSLDNEATYTKDETLAADESKTGTTGEKTAAEAKTITGYTAQSVEQKVIAADGSTVVQIKYNRNTHTVTYSYTNDPVPTGAPAVPAEMSYKYGATVNVSTDAVTLEGYDFSGWQKDGGAAPASFTMGDANVSITGTFTEHTYHVKFWKLEEGSEGNTVLSDQTFTVSSGTITPPDVPEKEWYDGTWDKTADTSNLSDQNIYPKYTEHTYTVTWKDEKGNEVTSEDNTFTKSDSSVKAPDVPVKPGYTGAWETEPNTNSPSDQTITATYTANTYRIHFVTAGNAIADLEYRITDTTELPNATRDGHYSFKQWRLTQATGEKDKDFNWGAVKDEANEVPGAVFNTEGAKTKVTDHYGEIWLTAEWNVTLKHTVEEYKYAADGYKMLLVSADGVAEGETYEYGGETMYYIEDDNYKVAGASSKGVFYTLIETSTTTLSDDQINKITKVTGDRKTIDYNGDINGDGKVNIADANAVFQMVAYGGGYYKDANSLTVEQRLRADMDKATDGTDALFRGSIIDVNEIVYKINGGRPKTNT